MPWTHARSSRYEWVSPSPSPIVVAELERLFPDIIQVPVMSLEEEIAKWKDQAIFAHSLARWVLPEALVRELHRAGISGKIEAVALAHRHYLLRFDDAQVTEFVLRRPWVVNGQPIAVAEWQQEFVPAESTLLQSLLWIRLPLLPIEFWSDDALLSILSAAGKFMYSDDSTRDRSRGGFARACVNVDLSKPLRPGARIRGSGIPFWQQFSYEHIDGICRSCGSLHLSEDCGSTPAASSSDSGFQFGPWMAALRRRKTPVV